MKKLIWLDDMRNPYENWLRIFVPNFEEYNVVWCKNYKEFKESIDDEFPVMVCFDHDLGEELTGYDCAKLMIDYCMEYGYDIPEYFIQSSNPVGRENITGYIENYKRIVENEERDT